MSLRAKWNKLRARRPIRWLLDGLLFLLAVWVVGQVQSRHLLSSGALAPPTQLRTLQGEPVSLEALRGKPVMVTFWAPWCGVCRAESDNLSRVQRLWGGRAHVVSIATSYQQVDEVQHFVDQNRVDYPVWLGGEPELKAWNVNQFPTTYFLDAQGRVKGSVVGYTTTLGLLSRLGW